MNSYTKSLKELETLKQNLKWDEEHVLSVKDRIAVLEKIVGEGQVSELEKEFLATKEKINDEIINIVGNIERDIINIGRAKICESVEKLSEETGIPLYVWSSITDTNSWYVPTTIGKWKDFDLKDFDIEADINVTGWQNSSVC